MRNSRLLVRCGLSLAGAAALAAPLAGSAAAASGISVSTTGSTVSVVTSACARNNGSWGTASLLANGQSSFAQGRQVALSGTTVSQSAAWSGVRPGTYTVTVICSSGAGAGTQAIIVSSGSAPTVSSTSAPRRTSAAPSRAVAGGLGGAARDYGPVTLGIGAGLAGSGVIAAAWFLRRRPKPYRRY